MNGSAPNTLSCSDQRDDVKKSRPMCPSTGRARLVIVIAINARISNTSAAAPTASPPNALSASCPLPRRSGLPVMAALLDLRELRDGLVLEALRQRREVEARE